MSAEDSELVRQVMARMSQNYGLHGRVGYPKTRHNLMIAFGEAKSDVIKLVREIRMLRAAGKLAS